MTVSNHGRLDYVVLTNTTFWNSLSPENKQIIEEAMRKPLSMSASWQEEENQKSFEKLKASGKMGDLYPDGRGQGEICSSHAACL